jgi:hypothetical protein
MNVWIILVIIVAVGVGLLILISRHSQPSLNRELVRNRWGKVLSFAKEGEAGKQQAVIEADKLVDYVLRQYNIRGDSMADRMRGAEDMIPNYQQLWQAHKLRNKLVHEQGVKLSKKDVQLSLRTYQTALKGLKAL